MPYGLKIRMEMNNCAFLRGICPYHTKDCNKPCDKYAPIGDASKQIFHDWNKGIDELKIRLRKKYFGVEINDFEEKSLEMDKKDLEEINLQQSDYDDLLGD